MKKIFFVISIFIIVIISLILIFSNKKIEKFYLEDEYYNKSTLINIDSKKLKKLEEKKESFLIYVHIPGVCNSTIPFEPIVKEFVDTKNIVMYDIDFNDIKTTKLDKYIKYSPSIVIYKDGNIISYLDAESNNDLKYYQSVEGLNSWINRYVILTKEN